jgi:hypothetical protein
MVLQLSCTCGFAEVSRPDDVANRTEYSDFGRTTVTAIRDVFTAPVQWDRSDWRTALYKTLVVAGTIAVLDEPVRDFIQDRRTDTLDQIAETFEPFGSQYAAGVLAAYALVGAFADKPGARQAAVDGIVSSIITSGMIVPALKSITGRSRPNTHEGASDFHPFNGGQSFPSGHTAAAFTIATSIAQNTSRPWVKGTSYGVASLVAYSRVESDAHWLSDVTASAFIGIAVAKRVANAHEHGPELVVTSLGPSDVLGIQLEHRF